MSAVDVNSALNPAMCSIQTSCCHFIPCPVIWSRPTVVRTGQQAHLEFKSALNARDVFNFLYKLAQVTRERKLCDVDFSRASKDDSSSKVRADAPSCTACTVSPSGGSQGLPAREVAAVEAPAVACTVWFARFSHELGQATRERKLCDVDFSRASKDDSSNKV